MKATCLSGIAFLFAAVSPRVGTLPLPEWIERCGWTLVHMTWQLALIGILAVLVMRLAQFHSSNVRYGLGVALLGLMVAAPAVTWSVLQQAPPAHVALHDQSPNVGEPNQDAHLMVEARSANATPSNASRVAQTSTDNALRRASVQPSPSRIANTTMTRAIVERIQQASETLREWIAPRLPLLVALWLVGVLGCSIRPALGLWMQRRLRLRGQTIAPRAVQDTLQAMARRMGVRQAVQVAQSALVKVPLVVGYLRPLVLLPASVLTGLTAPQLEAVLAHELAHIRRHDWIVNSLQVLVETLLFYHPAVWWLSRRIHHERELCCDDLALAVTGDRATYGRALLALEELRQHAPAPLLAATGGDLLARVRRLLPDEPRTPRIGIGGLLLVVLLLTAGAFGLLRQSQAQPVDDLRAALHGLPDVLKKLEGQGVSANLDQNGAVTAIYLGRPTTDALLAELVSLPQLRELHIETTKGVTAAGLAHLSKLPRLEKASFYSVNEQETGLGDAVIRSVAGLKSLRELSVGECGTTDEGCQTLAAMTQLTSLSLHQEGRLTDAALKPIGSLRQLKSLSLGSVVATERFGRMQFAEEGLQSLKNLSELEALNLVGHPVTADILVSNQLRGVSLGHSTIGDAVAARLAELPELRQLSLSFTGITDDGLKKLGSLKQLSQLDLSSDRITDVGVAVFEKHPALSYVSLRISNLTDVGVKSVATIPMLANLSLWGGSHFAEESGPKTLTIAGLKPLAAAPQLRVLSLTNWRTGGGWLALKGFNKLDQLAFVMCDISQANVDALDDACPDTQIVNATGGGGILRPATLEKQKRLLERARKKSAGSRGPQAGRNPIAAGASAAPEVLEKNELWPGRRLLGAPAERHANPPYELQFVGPDWLVSAGQDEARVWDVVAGKLLHVLPHGKGHLVRGLAASPDARWLVTSGFDDTLGVWERASGKRRHTLKGHGPVGGSRVVRFTPDGRQFVSWGDDAHLRCWDVNEGKLLAEHDLRLPGFAEQGQLGAISAGMLGTITRDAKSLFVRFQNELIEFDTGSGEIMRRVEASCDAQPLVMSPDGKWLATFQSERDARREYLGARVVLLDRATLRPVREWPVTEPGTLAENAQPPRPIFVGGGDQTMVFSPDSRRLAWSQSGARHQIAVADVASDRITHRITGPSVACSVEFSPNGKQLASGHLDSTIALCDWQHPDFAVVNQ